MAELISFKLASERRSTDVEQAWEQFRQAAVRSKETLDIRDGIAAGKAYRVFLEIFTRADR